jgi:hypothetical protein
MQQAGHAKLCSKSIDRGTFAPIALPLNLPIISLIFWKFAKCDFV